MHENKPRGHNLTDDERRRGGLTSCKNQDRDIKGRFIGKKATHTIFNTKDVNDDRNT